MTTHSTSTVIGVKRQLVTLITARYVTDNVRDEANHHPTVTYSHPGDELLVDSVYLGDVKDGFHEVPTMRAGRKHRDESYLVEVLIECVRPGGDAGDAETQALALLASLENVLADDPTLGLGDSTIRATLESWTSDVTFAPGTMGWRCKLLADVRVRARLV